MIAAATPRDPRSRSRLRELRRAETSALLATDAARAAIAVQGTPVLLLDPERVRRQYRRLRNALPFVRFHYAVKALSHDSVIQALAAAGCGFDVATGDELALLQRHGVAPEAVIHTHPVKKAAEIAHAIDAGVRTFVVDNEVELEKFAYRSSRGTDPGAPVVPQPAREERSVEQVRSRCRSRPRTSSSTPSVAASGSQVSASTSAASSTIRSASPMLRARR